MSSQYCFRIGADEPMRGMPIPAWIAAATAMEKAGLSGSALFDIQSLVMVEGGLRLAEGSSKGCVAISTEHGLAVAMPAGTQASVEREGGRVLRLLSALDGTFHSGGGPGSAPFQEPSGDQGIDPVAAQWLRQGERGRSSEELCRLFFGVPDIGGFSDDKPFPRDPSDLRRCILFLEFTGTAARLPEAASLSPQWAALVSRWDELSDLLALEAPSGTCPQCFAAMSEAIDQAEAARPRGPKA